MFMVCVNGVEDRTVDDANLAVSVASALKAENPDAVVSIVLL